MVVPNNTVFQANTFPEGATVTNQNGTNAVAQSSVAEGGEKVFSSVQFSSEGGGGRSEEEGGFGESLSEFGSELMNSDENALPSGFGGDGSSDAEICPGNPNSLCCGSSGCMDSFNDYVATAEKKRETESGGSFADQNACVDNGNTEGTTSECVQAHLDQDHLLAFYGVKAGVNIDSNTLSEVANILMT